MSGLPSAEPFFYLRGENMNYEEFKDALLAALRDFYGSDADIQLTDVVKLNDVHMDGISIIHKEGDTRMNPILYANDLYENYIEDGIPFEEIVGRVIDTREQNQIAPEIFDITKFLYDWNVVSGRVYPMLIQTESNKETLEHLVSTPFLDLSVIYYIKLDTLNEAEANVKITYPLLESLNITADQLHEQALYNLRNKDGLEIHSMAYILRDLLNVSDLPDAYENDTLHVLSNQSKMFGAAHLLNMDNLPAPYDNRSFYVIPSSIHEAILVDDTTIRADALDDMIRDVNSTILSPQEILSSHCYYYDGESRQLSICA